MWCKSCRVTGYTHCAHPDECGNMVTLTAAADSWKSWLDDAPLPETFNSATGGLQDFITALSRALLTARAELDTTQTQLGDWIVRADEANVKVETLEAELARVRADAAAAQALMVERAEDEVSGEVAAHGEAHLAPFVRKRIRALADPTGVKLLAELRAERDALAADGAGVFWAEKARAFAMQMASVDARAKDAESERDRLAAANAVLEAKVAGLRDFVDDFAKAKIDALRYSPPCGSSPEDDPDPVVDAETVWAWQADAKAALATQEAGNG